MIWRRDLNLDKTELTRTEAMALINSRLNWLRDVMWFDNDIPLRMSYWDEVISHLNQMRNEDLKYAYYKIAQIELNKETK